MVGAAVKTKATGVKKKMTTIISDALAVLDATLAPVTPPGVTGTQFISVFLLVYAIIFLLIKQTKVFKDNKFAQLLFALVVAYFTASSGFAVLFMSELFPNLGIVTVMLLAFLIVISMVGTDKLKMGPLMVFLGVGMIAYFTWTAVAGTMNLDLNFTMPALGFTEWALIIFGLIFLFIVILIYFAGSGGGKGEFGKKAGDFFKWLFEAKK